MNEKDLAKVLISYVNGLLQKGDKEVTNEIVNDILDDNSEAQVDPKKVPAGGSGSLYKNKQKGIEKLKVFVFTRKKQ